MRKFKILVASTLFLSLAVACQKDEVAPIEEPTAAEEVVQQSTLELNDEVIGVFKRNFFNVGNVKVVDFMLPDGSYESRYQVEDDITFSAEQYEILAALNTTEKNYHTNNLVSSPRTISIIGYTGGSNALSSKERTALQYAVNNYNRLNLSISFSLTFGTNYQNKDMVVYYNPNASGSGGSAGFPSGGRPFKFVQIYGLDNFSTDVNEHVITHEIGHSVGFRHTDWFSRQSCGENTNEGVGSIGANPIPGTPDGYDPTSVMLACFSNNEDGEFNSNDVTALRYLY
ncbi:peptidase [Flavobacteriaceae bacterium TP-CH-4]|uniref:Peptidase n=1 Tax=Pelagihabitans pacificus TaxID=2696054 RepID=A0A967E420_9FLAO|nr:M57 family metalloprotease [Pelagihabitans pacificus]NHF57947.1 peptidase [Pelagihabitans pacificus]